MSDDFVGLMGTPGLQVQLSGDDGLPPLWHPLTIQVSEQLAKHGMDALDKANQTGEPPDLSRLRTERMALKRSIIEEWKSRNPGAT
jgi:hypothetical protein